VSAGPKTPTKTITQVTHAVATVAAPVTKTRTGLLAQATRIVTGGVAGTLTKVPARSIAQGVTHAIAGLTGSPLKALAQGLGQITHALAGLSGGPATPLMRVANAVAAALESAAAPTSALATASSMAGARSLLGWPAPPATFVSARGSPASGSSDHGSPGVASRALPGPAPVQGFAFPASAGNAGFGFSIFLMLAGLLLLGALLVSGRLRLSSEPWRPAPFVLILDRPG
jgi:hypothetical protein